MEEINFNKLKVDKEDATVKYNDEVHKYWTKDGNYPCISATTLIHKFQNFDEGFWASYKALEASVTSEEFKTVKPLLLKSKLFMIDYEKLFGITDDIFEENRNKILKQWADKRDASCIRGTAIHLEHEKKHLAGNTQELKSLGLKGSKFNTKVDNLIKPGVQTVYPELLLSRISKDGKLRIAGQADLVIVDGFDVHVLDYKTNEKMETKAYFDQRTKKKTTMKYPLTNIEDTNFWHYSLQLSLYGWMIQMIDPRFVIKTLRLIHYDHDGGCTDYDCDYLKKDIVRMLSFHKKQVEYEKFGNDRKKITF